jgi:hypothetical protein
MLGFLFKSTRTCVYRRRNSSLFLSVLHMKPNMSAQLSPAKRPISASSSPISHAINDVNQYSPYGDDIGLLNAMNPNGDKTARPDIDIPNEWGIQSQYIRGTHQNNHSDEVIAHGDRGYNEHGSMIGRVDKEHCCFFCSRGAYAFKRVLLLFCA